MKANIDLSRQFLFILSLLGMIVISKACSSSAIPMVDEMEENMETEVEEEQDDEPIVIADPMAGCNHINFIYEEVVGCDGRIYQDPRKSPYIIPFAAGTEFNVGLSNCSRSFHGPGQLDEYAYDFDFPTGTPFIAARAGRVLNYRDTETRTSGGLGNYVVIEHEDGTYGWYLHSPQNGITVHIGQTISQGDTLGVVGATGLAGYPHLHFIVTESIDYDGMPVNFNNFFPLVTVLESFETYQVCGE